MVGPTITVKLQELTDTQGADGSITQSWTTVATFKSSFGPLKAEERMSFDKQTVFATHRLMFDYVTLGSSNASKLVEKNRIQIDTTDYDITGVQDFNAGAIGRHYEVLIKLVTT